MVIVDFLNGHKQFVKIGV